MKRTISSLLLCAAILLNSQITYGLERFSEAGQYSNDGAVLLSEDGDGYVQEDGETVLLEDISFDEAEDGAEDSSDEEAILMQEETPLEDTTEIAEPCFDGDECAVLQAGSSKPSIKFEKKSITVTPSNKNGGFSYESRNEIKRWGYSYIFANLPFPVDADSIGVYSSDDSIVSAYTMYAESYNMCYITVYAHKPGKVKVTAYVRSHPEIKPITIKVSSVKTFYSVSGSDSFGAKSDIQLAKGKRITLKAKGNHGSLKTSAKNIKWTVLGSYDFSTKKYIPVANNALRIDKKGTLKATADCPAGDYYVKVASAWDSSIADLLSVQVTDVPLVFEPQVYALTNYREEGGKTYADLHTAKKNILSIPARGVGSKFYYIGVATPGYNGRYATFPAWSKTKCGKVSADGAFKARIGDTYYVFMRYFPKKAGTEKITLSSRCGVKRSAKLTIKVLNEDETGDIKDCGFGYDGIRIKDGMAQPILNYNSGILNGKIDNKNEILRFCVYVESDYDTDGDGKRDLVKAFIQAPAGAVRGEYKSGIIFDPTPYSAGSEVRTQNFSSETDLRSGNFDMRRFEKTNVPKRVSMGQSTCLQQAKAAKLTDWSYSMASNQYTAKDNSGYSGRTNFDYYLTRGFTVVRASGLGTYGSEGYAACGSEAEANGLASVVEWLHGDRAAYTDRTHNIRIKADFSNGNVAATGVSYGGAMSYALASTGVEGLKTIVPIAGISSWYEYTNFQGIPRGGLAQYSNWLSGYVASRLYESDAGNWAPDYINYLKTSARHERDMNGVYYREDVEEPNFYVERDYTKNPEKIKCSALIIHGLHDFNVSPRNSRSMYETMISHGNEVKLILTQGAHDSYMNKKINGTLYQELLNKWLCHYLYNVDNGVETLMPEVLVQRNEDLDTWDAYDSWEGTANTVAYTRTGSAAKTPSDAYLNSEGEELIDYSFIAPLETIPVDSVSMDDIGDIVTGLDGEEAAADIPAAFEHGGDYTTANEYISRCPSDCYIRYDIANKEYMIKGTPSISFSAAPDKNYGKDSRTMICAVLIDYVESGSFDAQMKRDYGDSVYTNEYVSNPDGTEDIPITKTITQETDSQIVSIGYGNLNMPNAGRSPSKSDKLIDIKTGNYYNYTIYMEPTVYHVPQGHRLKLILMTYDPNLARPWPIAQKHSYTVESGSEVINLPK